MIRVEITRGWIKVNGHAGAGAKGSDPVCAAVSTLAWTLIYGISEVIGIEVTILREAKGELEAVWKNDNSREELVLVETVCGSLREIAKKNPKRIIMNDECAS